MENRLEVSFAQYLQSPDEDTPYAINAIVNGRRKGVPLDPANTTYAEIMRQVEAGELVIQEADTPE